MHPAPEGELALRNDPVDIATSSRVMRPWFEAWRSLGLTTRFAITATLVITLCMSLLGNWVSQRIMTGVVQNAASSVAFYVVGFVEPYVQELVDTPMLSSATIGRLDRLIHASVLTNKKIVTLKIWGRDGALLYSPDRAMIGQTFPQNETLLRAWSGEVASEFNRLDDAESRAEQQLNRPLLETYAPLRKAGSDMIIGVVEIYEEADTLAADLRRTWYETACAIAAFSLALIGSLLHIVNQGSKTIAEQQRALSNRITDLSRLLESNRRLRRRVAEANRRAVEENERFLRRVGAELHDGPVQLVSLALLRLELLKPPSRHGASSEAEVYDVVNQSLGDALGEIRAICAGMTIPDLQALELEQAISVAASSHERRTGTTVAVRLADVPPHVPPHLVATIYRFVQEGLNNAFRHAAGQGQSISATRTGSVLLVSVSDTGGGFVPGDATTTNTGLGLPGLRSRIMAVGGELEVDSTSRGTNLTATFDLNQLE